MRFTRQQRHDYEVTDRKRQAAARWQQRERESLPLLAAEIAAQQPAIDAVMAGRVDRWTETQKADRSHKAAQWREGRRKLDGMEPEARTAIMAYWNRHKWLPGTPVYFLDMLHSIEAGRLVRDGGTFRFASRGKASEAMQIDPARKPPLIPGLVRQRPAAGEPKL